MYELNKPTLPKWPFMLGDACLLGVAIYISTWGQRPLDFNSMLLLVVSVALGAALAALPFVLEYKAQTRLAEADSLTTVVSQIGNVQSIAAQIAAATGRWQTVQEESEKVAAAVKGIAERMTAEVQGFSEFIERANDAEKGNLRLEVEKLRRAERDWLEALVRVLDHIYALHMGALRSGQPNLIEQLTMFQNACRDAARRVGLTPFIPQPAETFDPERHKLIDGEAAHADGGSIGETVATGYTFQGRLLRPALVRLRPEQPEPAPQEEGKG